MDAYWEYKPLAEMNQQEWEGVCDGCGKCCLHKLQCDESDEVYYTDIACGLLDLENCRCSDYSNRLQRVPACLSLSLKDIPNFHWLPESCGYRRLSEGKPLLDWHPLISGSAQSVHEAGVSVLGRCVPERGVDEHDYEEHIIHWVSEAKT